MAKRHNKTGRSTSAQHVRIYHWMMNCPAWAELKPSDRAVLIELMRRYNGFNNGQIGLSQRSAAKHCKITKGTAKAALDRLEHLGFIKKRLKGSFSNKTQIASEFELTHESYNQQPATKDFMKYKPLHSSAHLNSAPPKKNMPQSVSSRPSASSAQNSRSSTTKVTPVKKSSGTKKAQTGISIGPMSNANVI